MPVPAPLSVVEGGEEKGEVEEEDLVVFPSTASSDTSGDTPKFGYGAATGEGPDLAEGCGEDVENKVTEGFQSWSFNRRWM